MQENKLFVGNLSYSTDEQELRELFSEYGSVVSINLIKNKGFGFVEMSNAKDAQTAREALNYASVSGRNINVNEARPQKVRPRPNFGRY